VPNANHQQRWEGGRYAVPETVLGLKVAGASKLSNGEWAGERGDMVLENDIVFGRVLELLETLPDPRNGGKPMIENTLVIFTSDNGPNEGKPDAPSYQSGGLRGKKAKITEGGLRVPYLMYWKGRYRSWDQDPNYVNRRPFALTDLYATFAKLIGHDLEPADALDSYDVTMHWGRQWGQDDNMRLKFCNLGPPFRNDAMILRRGGYKMVTEGGVAEPGRIPKGTAGEVVIKRFHDLYKDPFEMDGSWPKDKQYGIERAEERILRIHNQGYARYGLYDSEDNRPDMIFDDGWHNLRNDLDGEIGFVFKLEGKEPLLVTHLGMWDDHEEDKPIREATVAPDDSITETPSVEGCERKLSSSHTIRLSAVDGEVIASVSLHPDDPGELRGEFRYRKLAKAVKLSPEVAYQITQSTSKEDGDLFHNPASYDGISPRVNFEFGIVRSIYLQDGKEVPIPTYFEAHPDYWKYRLPVGPTLLFENEK